MEYETFIRKVKITDTVEELENRKHLTYSAFTAWLSGAAEKNKSFLDFCKDLGLVDRPKLSEYEAKIIKEIEKEKALMTAKKIVELDKKRKV